MLHTVAKDFIHAVLFFLVSFLLGGITTVVYFDKFYMANVKYEVEINDLATGSMIMWSKDPITGERYISKIENVDVDVSWHKERLSECRFNLVKECRKVY